MGLSGGTSAGGPDGATVGVAAEIVGVAALSTDNLARGNRVLPCPARGRTVGVLEGASVAAGVAVGV